MQCRKAEIAASPGITGSLRVQGALRGERTVIVDAYRTAPFNLGELSQSGEGEGAEVVIQGVGPGYLPGDRVEIDLAAGPGATLAVRDQAALKLFPSISGDSAQSRVHLVAEPGATLIYLPGELVPYRRSIYAQRVTIDADPTARIAYAEIITPGRLAAGEAFAFTRLDLRLDVAVAGKPIVRERSFIEPALRSPRLVGRMGTFACSGALYLIGSEWGSPANGTTETGAIWATDRTEEITLVRYAAQTAQEIHQIIRRHLAGVL